MVRLDPPAHWPASARTILSCALFLLVCEHLHTVQGRRGQKLGESAIQTGLAATCPRGSARFVGPGNSEGGREVADPWMRILRHERKRRPDQRRSERGSDFSASSMQYPSDPNAAAEQEEGEEQADRQATVKRGFRVGLMQIKHEFLSA